MWDGIAVVYVESGVGSKDRARSGLLLSILKSTRDNPGDRLNEIPVGGRVESGHIQQWDGLWWLY